MTSTSTRLLSLSILSAIALTGCPGTTSVDAGVDASAPDARTEMPDAVCTGCCDASCVDAFRAADAFASVDAYSADDAPHRYNAIVASSCGPADGPAIELNISDTIDRSSCSPDPLRASTTFYIHDLGGATLPPTPGATITSVDGAIHGNASQCPGGSPPCRSSEHFSVTFATYSVTGGASGQYTIQWSDGTTTSGTFDADRCMSRPPVCG